MKIVTLADLHGELPLHIEPCDLLLIAGDITGGNPSGPRAGDDDQWHSWCMGAFNDWCLAQQPYIVAIAGNHDTCLENSTPMPSCIYLRDNSVNFNGLNIYGTPYTKRWDTLAFQEDEHALRDRWASIPANTDIILSHGPMYGIGDWEVQGSHLGSCALRDAVERVKPKLLVHGHIHGCSGVYKYGETTVVNSARTSFTVEI